MPLNHDDLDQIEKRRKHQSFLKSVRDMSLLIIAVSAATFLIYALHVSSR